MCIIESQKLKDVLYLAGNKEEFQMLLEIINREKSDDNFRELTKARLFIQVKEAIEEAIEEEQK